MTLWTPTTLVTIDEKGDQAQASDGYSRYGAYITQRLDEFQDDGPERPLPADAFAAAAWRVATPPVLTGYANLRPDLNAITPVFPDDDDNYPTLAFRIDVPLWHDDLAPGRRPRYPWQDWTVEYDLAAREEEYRRIGEPTIGADRPAVFTMASVIVSAAGWPLPTPRHTSGRGLVDDAIAAVRAIAAGINQHAGPMVAQLRGEQGT